MSSSSELRGGNLTKHDCSESLCFVLCFCVIFSVSNILLNVVGFGWNLNFKWDFLPPKPLEQHRKDPSAPIKYEMLCLLFCICFFYRCFVSYSCLFLLRSPTIAGGLFSIDKRWFEELGKYDMDMDVWGGENLGVYICLFVCF